MYRLRVLHTSDWHLGRSLYKRKRYDEFAAFLDWLVQTITQQEVDALLVAGDVFDTTLPTNHSQEQYYDVLSSIAKTCCRHVVIIGGNHDSPSFLNTSKPLLKMLNIHVVGAMTENIADEVIVLHKDGQPEAIVCAVPYLRDKDIRTVEPGESSDAKNAKLVNGLKKHYAEVCAIAEQKRNQLKNGGHDVPLIAMGHLWAKDGKPGDGVRDLYIGSLLGHAGEETFPAVIDYVALGHLHVAQTVGSAEHIRYSGSPIPMGFGEAKQEKKVILVEFNKTTPQITELTVPCFQQLVRIAGTLETIIAKLQELKQEKSTAWLEIEYNGERIIPNLNEQVNDALAGSNMELRRLMKHNLMEQTTSQATEQETLDDLEPIDVFMRYLRDHNIAEEDRDELIACYKEIIKSIDEKDTHAE